LIGGGIQAFNVWIGEFEKAKASGDQDNIRKIKAAGFVLVDDDLRVGVLDEVMKEFCANHDEKNAMPPPASGCFSVICISVMTLVRSLLR
jgi:hypothetical protein